MKTRIGIMGYGNLGRGVEAAIHQNEDLELVAVFTRRDPGSLAITPGIFYILGLDNCDPLCYRGHSHSPPSKPLPN